MPAKRFYALYIHIVWITKKRRPLLEPEWRKQLFLHIKKEAVAKGYHVEIVNGVSDHVHALVSMKPQEMVSKLVKDLKGASSRWINEQQFTYERFEWSRGYGAFAVSPQHIQRVRNYILNQEEHHLDFSLQDEIELMESWIPDTNSY